MELIERFTIDGTAILRNTAHTQGIPHKTAHVWVVNSRKEILLQKRALCKESHPGCWDVSSAGHITFGQTVVESAIRECFEEIGLAVTSSDLVPLGTLYQEFINVTPGFIDREWVDSFIVCRDLPESAFTVQVEEVSEVKWFDFEIFCAMTVAKSPDLVDHCQEYQLLIAYLSAN